MFATGLAAGILLDATVVRALLVPAVVSLFGPLELVAATVPARLLRVEPSIPPRVATGEGGALARRAYSTVQVSPERSSSSSSSVPTPAWAVSSSPVRASAKTGRSTAGRPRSAWARWASR